MKKRAVIISFVMIILLLIFGFIFRYFFFDKSYEITESYKVTTIQGKKTYLSVDLPITYGYQKIGDIIIENADIYTFADKDGYKTLNIEITGDGKEKTILIKYDLTLLNGKSTWDSVVLFEYSQPAEFIDSDNQNIIQTVIPLIIKGDDYKTAQNICSYVSERIMNGKSPDEKMLASEVLEKRRGVCGDYATLTTAMLRAANIPAKCISGLVFNDLHKPSDWSHPAGSHAWVEFYADGRWHFADTTWGNLYFDRPDGFHLSYGLQIGDIRSHAYQDKKNEIQSKGYKLIGGMTAPIKFMAWSEDENAKIIPKVIVK